MKFRKIAALALTAVLFLTACEKPAPKNDAKPSAKTKDTETEASKAETKQTKTDEAKPADGKSLTVWCWDPNFNIYAMKEAEKIYQKDHPDFKLNIVETPWPDVQTKIITAATSKDYSTLPDILLMQDLAFQKNAANYPELFADLEKSGIKFEDFAKAKASYSTVNGKHLGVPFDNGTVVAAYRTDLLKQAGYKIDDMKDITWSKFIEIGKKVVEKTGKPLLTNIAGENDTVMMMLQSAGASMFDKDGNVTLKDNEIMKKVFQIYLDMKKSGVLGEVNDWDQYIGSMTGGNTVGVLNGCWILASVQTAKDQSGKWAITNMPKLDGVESATNYSNNGGSSWVVIDKSKNKELAFDFLKTTFGSSVSLYETILPKSGALSTYIPAGKSDIYAKPQEFFGGQAIYKDLTDFATKVPYTVIGAYHYEARDAVATALHNFIDGKDLNAELAEAQKTVEFAMGK